MEQLIIEFEKALAVHKAAIGKTDNLIGFGEILVREFRKTRDANVILGQLLGDFYADARKNGERAFTDKPMEIYTQRMNRQ